MSIVVILWLSIVMLLPLIGALFSHALSKTGIVDGIILWIGFDIIFVLITALGFILMIIAQILGGIS